MKRSRFTEQQIAFALQQAEQGTRVSERIRVDNGPEFISKELDLWAYAKEVELDFPGQADPQIMPS